VRLSPRTNEHARRLRALGYAYASRGEEAVHLLGFDWRVVVSVMGPLGSPSLQSLVLGSQSDRCWRALLYVGTSDVHGRIKVHILEVGGGGVFAMYYYPNKRGLHWCSPEETVVSQLRQLSKQ
jgi:hypothetical protein